MKKKGSELLNQLLILRNQMKLYHWQTDLYSRHKASDKFLKKADNLIDEIIEAYQGKYGLIKLDNKNKNIKLDNINDKDIIKFLLILRDFLQSNFKNFINQNKNTDLLNLRDELISIINITLYLFNQK
jgi:DNA-binding ferritin-like protein